MTNRPLQDNDLFIEGRYAGDPVIEVARKDPAYIEQLIREGRNSFSNNVMYAISEEGITAQRTLV